MFVNFKDSKFIPMAVKKFAVKMMGADPAILEKSIKEIRSETK